MPEATLGMSVSTKGGRRVELDVGRLIETRLLVQANSGGGKSWALRRLLEQTHGKVQHIVIDPEGEFATLRERYDYVLAGQDGDCAAEPKSAHLLARKLLELGVSAICDIYELKQHQRIEFVERFLTALVNAPKRLWHPVLVVLDEAHVFCPERGKASSGAAVIDLATRGRKRGMCAVLATQRLSKLRKDAAAELNNVLIGRTGLDVDIARAADSLGLTTRDDRQALRFLKPGQFYGFGPGLPDGVTMIHVGDVQTTHPTLQHGRIASVAPPPTPRIKAMLSELTDLPETAVKEARDLDTLRRENAGLKTRIRHLERSGGIDEAEVSRRVAEVAAGLQVELDETTARLDQIEREARSHLEDLYSQTVAAKEHKAQLDTAVSQIQVQVGQIQSLLAAKAPQRTRIIRSSPPRRQTAKVESQGESELSRPQQAILDALMILDAMGVTSPARTHVAAFAGASPRSSAYGNNLGRLRSLGLIDYPSSGLVELTAAGRECAAPVATPPTSDDLRDRWLAMVTAPQGRILRALFAVWPGAITRTTLAEQADASHRSSAYGNNLGRLRSLGLVEYVPGDNGARGVRASDDLFEVGTGA